MSGQYRLMCVVLRPLHLSHSCYKKKCVVNVFFPASSVTHIFSVVCELFVNRPPALCNVSNFKYYFMTYIIMSSIGICFPFAKNRSVRTLTQKYCVMPSHMIFLKSLCNRKEKRGKMQRGMLHAFTHTCTRQRSHLEIFTLRTSELPGSSK